MLTELKDADTKLLIKMALDQRIFLDDWEFETIFGIARDELVELQAQLLSGRPCDKGVIDFLEGTIRGNLIAYPHRSAAYIRARYGVRL
jgi:hypothetical protein